jgi:phosphoglycerol geranylgeranyltransferase
MLLSGAVNRQAMLYKFIKDTLGKRKMFALHVDPDKYDDESLVRIGKAAGQNGIDFILTGGSLISNPIDHVVRILKENTDVPVILFPGNVMQISGNADGIFLLCLISGRNPEYLIGNHVIAAPILKKSGLEIIPTSYILIENGRLTSVEYISNTKPIPADKVELAVATALAGEMLGHRLLYLEAGSGAIEPVKTNLIAEVKRNITIPLIVGGGIQKPDQLYAIYDAGADVIVIGTALEKDLNNLEVLAGAAQEYNGIME